MENTDAAVNPISGGLLKSLIIYKKNSYTVYLLDDNDELTISRSEDNNAFDELVVVLYMHYAILLH